MLPPLATPPSTSDPDARWPQWQDQDVRATFTNPLPSALAHYEAELVDCLEGWRCEAEGHPGEESVEGYTGTERLARGVTLVARRLRSAGSDVHLVLWPAFGYLDALTWLRRSRRQPVVLIVHDVDPLRRQFGHSRAARRLFGQAVRAGDLTVVCHTAEAGQRLEAVTGACAAVVPHPMLAPDAGGAPLTEEFGGRLVVRVVGQYKDARELGLLTALARQAGDGLSLEIWGRGWPPVPGWQVEPGFVPEHEFARLIATSAAVVIPYSTYSQSGVMVRAAESGVPVVGVDHPQLRFLYGERWPGIVPGGGDWSAGIHGAIGARASVPTQVAFARAHTRDAWRRLMEGIAAQ